MNKWLLSIITILIPITIISFKKNETNFIMEENKHNVDNIKVNISLKNKTMHLRLSPYQTLWLDVTPN